MDPVSLQNLHDIVVPARVPWWPPAPGWYVVGAALVVACTVFAWRAYRRWARRAYRRAALAELASLRATAADPRTRAQSLRSVSVLVKRVALGAFQRTEVAGLSGEAWLLFLDRSGPAQSFSSGPARALATLPYDPSVAAGLSPAEAEDLFDAAERWIRGHRIEPHRGK